MALFNRILYIFVAATLLAASAAACATEKEPVKCATDMDCVTGEFCDTTPKCPGGKNKGTCAIRPQFCTEDYNPVTACNNKEYSNRCHAATDGQPITKPSKK